MDNERMLKVPDVARRLEVHEQTVRIWLRSGHLKGFRPGGDKAGWRIPESEIRRLVEGEAER